MYWGAGFLRILDLPESAPSNFLAKCSISGYPLGAASASGLSASEG